MTRSRHSRPRPPESSARELSLEITRQIEEAVVVVTTPHELSPERKVAVHEGREVHDGTPAERPHEAAVGPIRLIEALERSAARRQREPRITRVDLGIEDARDACLLRESSLVPIE